MKLRDTLTHLTYVIGDDTTISDKHQLCDVRVCVREQNRLPNDSCKLYSSEQTKYTPTILIIISHSTKSNRKKEREADEEEEHDDDDGKVVVVAKKMRWKHHQQQQK